jgi:hypothetical protein
VTDKASGRLYYYSDTGERTWTRPTVPTKVIKPEVKVKELSHEERLQQIINSVTKNNTPKDKSPTVETPQNGNVELEEQDDSWRSMPEEKQKRIYENTLFPHIKYVVDKYKHKLPKEDIKRFGKDVSTSSTVSPTQLTMFRYLRNSFPLTLRTTV